MMEEFDEAKKDREGFVIVGGTGGGLFLSRSGRWVTHADRKICCKKISGAERAWVHPKEFLEDQGAWRDQTTQVIPARYDKETDYTVLLGPPVPFNT